MSIVSTGQVPEIVITVAQNQMWATVIVIEVALIALLLFLGVMACVKMSEQCE